MKRYFDFFKKLVLIIGVVFISVDQLFSIDFIGKNDYHADNRTIPQERIVSGTVTNQDGEPMVGVTIQIQGTTLGTLTDNNGKYTVSCPSASTLIFSFIGYETQVIEIGNRSVINVQLISDVELLDEVVVVGYGVQKKSNLTGAISSVKTDDIVNRAVDNIGQVIQGKVAGVQTLVSSGAPGAGTTIRIRGYSSKDTSEPLVVVDGIKGGRYGDVNDIESIEILKDGASAAIYGAEAGNGVIIITTKSGSRNKQGQISYNGMYTTQNVGKMPPVLNAAQYQEYMTVAGVYSQDYFNEFWDGKTDTRWVNEMFETGIVQRHTLSFSGGNEKGNIYTSLTINNNDGMFKGNKDISKRVSLQLNADYQFKTWFKLSTAATLSYGQSKAVSASSYTGSTMGAAVMMDPLTPVEVSTPTPYMQNILDAGYTLVKNPQNGNYWGITPFQQSEQSNPFIMRDRSDPMNKNYGLGGNITALFTPVKDLAFTSRFGYGINAGNGTNFDDLFYSCADQYRLKINFSANASVGYNYLWENFANYTKVLNDHTISLMAGMSFQYRYGASVNGNTNQLTNNAPNFRYLSNSAGTAIRNVGGGENESASMSYYGRAGWNYLNRYDFQLTFRADAYDTSKLHEDSRWGYFPSVSAGWNISNEDFFSSVNRNFLSHLRIRASYGINGNVNILSGYPYKTTLNLGGYYPLSYDGSHNVMAASPGTRLVNTDLHWETAKQVNIGVDARLLKDRLTLTIDYFDKNTTGMLLESTPPASSGSSSVFVNAGRVNNHGVEIELGWRDRVKQEFTYGVSANFATLSNRVAELKEKEFIAGAGNHSNTITYFQEGHSIWYYRAYILEGIDQTTGASIYKDTNNDEQITDADRIDVGSGIPSFTYGGTLNLGYKNFDLNIYGTGAAGFNIFTCVARSDRPYSNRYTYFLEDAWLPTNSPEVNLTKRYPKPDKNDDKFLVSDAMLNKGDFFKIKQIQLGYTLPQTLLRKISISSLRVYTSLEDFFTFTSYPGIDPEIVSAGGGNRMGLDMVSYPISRKVTFGVNLTF